MTKRGTESDKDGGAIGVEVGVTAPIIDGTDEA